jgi:hypothetical protein
MLLLLLCFIQNSDSKSFRRPSNRKKSTVASCLGFATALLSTVFRYVVVLCYCASVFFYIINRTFEKAVLVLYPISRLFCDLVYIFMLRVMQLIKFYTFLGFG